MTYINNNKRYNVEEVVYGGAIINVNGTSITDLKVMGQFTGISGTGYSVFVNSDEVAFDTFEEAYQFAMNEQKDTFRNR